MAFRVHRQDHDDIVDSAEPDYDIDGSCAPVEFYAGERVCASQPIRRRRPLLRTIVGVCVLAGSGYLWLRLPPDLRADVTSVAADAGSSLLARLYSMRAPAVPPPEEHAATAVPPPITETEEIAPMPGAEAGTPVDVPAPEAADDGSAEDGVASSTEDDRTETAEEAPDPLPPPKADPNDPLQKRALAVGLHPDLSKAVLARLTDRDFKNAGIAIQRALKDTPDHEVLTWPKGGGGAALASFAVHFVRGSASDCRRYVVVVTKNRWSSTALPMERCGLARPTVANKDTGTAAR